MSDSGDEQSGAQRRGFFRRGPIGLATAGAAWGFGQAGRLLGSTLRLAGLYRTGPTGRRPAPGTAPGIEAIPDRDTPPAPDAVTIQCVEYNGEHVQTRDIPLAELEDFLAEPTPEWCAARWVNVNGLHPYIVDRFHKAYGFHTLAAEDILHVPQRPKAEAYEDHLFVVTRMLMLGDDGQLRGEQVSMFLYANVLVTFQEHAGDVWDPIRQRIHANRSKMRRGGAAYLLYALLDALVDHCFPILERYTTILEQIETEVLERPSQQLLHQLHAFKRELSLLRRVMWPTRELVARLYRDDSGLIDESTQTYLRDVHDHSVQIIDIIETSRETAGGLTDLYLSAVSNRMNEIMKVLTIMASIFIPLTFIAGIYGMNFEHMPELEWPLGYPMIWGVFILTAGALLWFFRRKGWIGR